MKRILSGLILLLVLTATAGAHSLSISGAVSLHGSELTLRVMDFYGAAVEGARVTAAAGLPGGKQSKQVRLTEVSPGTYRGKIITPGSGAYEIIVEVTVLEELFRGPVKAQFGQDLPETMMPLAPIDLQSAFTWGPIFFGMAVIAVLTATAVALLRGRRTSDEEDA